MKDDPEAFPDGIGVLLRVDSEGTGPACVTVGVMLRNDLNPTCAVNQQELRFNEGSPVAQLQQTYLGDYLSNLLEI